MSQLANIRCLLGYDMPVDDGASSVPIYFAGFSGISNTNKALQFTYEPDNAFTFSNARTASLFRRMWNMPSAVYIASRRYPNKA